MFITLVVAPPQTRQGRFTNRLTLVGDPLPSLATSEARLGLAAVTALCGLDS